jgi:hypothetical protein
MPDLVIAQILFGLVRYGERPILTAAIAQARKSLSEGGIRSAPSWFTMAGSSPGHNCRVPDRQPDRSRRNELPAQRRPIVR